MGPLSRIDPFRWSRLALVLLRIVVLLSCARQTSAWAQVTGHASNASVPRPETTSATLATTVPILLPTGIAYDSTGNLYVAEAAGQLVVRVTPTGTLSPVAGTGVQGFAGDGGPATAALLDTPVALAVDSAGNVLIADSHNHRIRRVDAGTGLISTLATIQDPSALAIAPDGSIYVADRSGQSVLRVDVVSGALTPVAGNGVEGFSGDGGPAPSASLDQPMGLAIDGSNHLFIADSHNGRVRVVNLQTGVISTLAGLGALRLPQGVVSDTAGDLLVAERGGNRVLQVSAGAAIAGGLAGTGTQGFAGDGGPAVAALLDSPASVALSAAGLPVLADTANGRVRSVDSAGVIHTIAGLGNLSATTLALSAPSVLAYGGGAVLATLNATAATGQVNFFNTPSEGIPVSLGSAALQANSATFSLSSLAAGSYRISATYAGDGVHASAASQTLGLTIAQAQATAAPAAVTLLYGQSVPVLSGMLTGILPQDSGNVTLGLTSGATSFSGPGVYPIVASLSGSAAGNYSLATVPASVIETRAPAAATLNQALAVHVVSTTAGTPTGVVTLLDGASAIGSAVLDAGDNASFAGSTLSSGTHVLQASYAGNLDFLPVVSPPINITIQPVSAADFTLSATGQTAVTVAAGSAAQYSFAVTPVNGALSSEIVLSASGVPPGATASFNPTYLPPANVPSAFIMTISTPKAALTQGPPAWFWAMLLPLLLVRRRRLALTFVVLLGLSVFASGCGDRVNNANAVSAGARSYTIVVSATATAPGGGTLLHTATVTLTLQ
jgi:sugar lactone lactonase YvrE